MVGESYAMRQLREQVAMAAPTNGRVLIYGENGTGKEMVARMIHALSRRHAAAFVEVNCAAIPEELIESELFGHVRGAFTGAVADRRGKFEVADGGTLFLDEIGDMSLKTQAKVLRVLQEQTMEAVGGTARIKVDTRVLAATNKDLQTEIRGGRFREDLYFRLNVIPIFVPPLRDRQEDVPLLADHFMAEFSREYGRRLKTFEPGARSTLQRYPWPGNVRELRNVIERLMIMVPGDTISAARSRLPRSGRTRAVGEAAEFRRSAHAARGARSVRARSDSANPGRAAGQHVADRRCARRRTQQSVSEDEDLRHRAVAPRGRGNRDGVTVALVFARTAQPPRGQRSFSVLSSTWADVKWASCR